QRRSKLKVAIQVMVKPKATTGINQSLVRKTAEAALNDAGLSKTTELSVLLTTDEHIHELNSKYRGKDKPTDVLSFPMDDEVLLGDVVISIERTVQQSKRFGVTPKEEFVRLLVHGILHLLGYDHVNGGRQAAKMKRKEEELMAELASLYRG
ncbi:MAG: rRNA maturation RNase YbeY, partial [Deltaproteobacteria bacterium]|nr:rRNA maturation RNase YbeY [Deltaproteobacteria bacterium]